MNPRTVLVRTFAAATVLAFFAFGGGSLAFAKNSLYGTYDFEGQATITAKSPDLPFGLGSIDLSDTFPASGSLILNRGRLTVQLVEPINRREVIRLDRKIRSPKRNSYRYRKSGTTNFRGNNLDYRIVLNLRRTAGKWGGRATVETKVNSGSLAGSKADISGRVEQR